MTEQPDPVAAALRLRASDADREKVAGLLRDAYAAGRLSPVEHEERLSEVYRATTYGELVPVLHDLPLPPGALTLPGVTNAVAVNPSHAVASAAASDEVVVDPNRADQSQPGAIAFMSETKRQGHWVVPADSTAVALMGKVELDLSQAVLTSARTEIRAHALMGQVSIIVPAGVIVQSTVVAIMGEAKEPPHDPPSGAPVVVVSGFAFMGSVEISRASGPWRRQVER